MKCPDYLSERYYRHLTHSGRGVQLLAYGARSASHAWPWWRWKEAEKSKQACERAATAACRARRTRGGKVMLQGAYVVGKHNRNTENVLGYVIAPQGPESYLIGVLAGSVVRGGPDWKNGPITVNAEDLRPATPKDFAAYRVRPPHSTEHA